MITIYYQESLEMMMVPRYLIFLNISSKISSIDIFDHSYSFGKFDHSYGF